MNWLARIVFSFALDSLLCPLCPHSSNAIQDTNRTYEDLLAAVRDICQFICSTLAPFSPGV